MDRVQKQPPNSCQALIRRELGLSCRRLSELLFVRPFFANIANNKYTDAFCIGHQTQVYFLRVQYPSAVTYEKGTINLWNFETGKCQWSAPIVSFFMCYGVELLEDMIVCTGQPSSISDQRVCVLHRGTGKKTAEYIFPQLSEGNHLCGKQRDFFIGGNKQITRYSLDTGGILQKIDSEEFVDLWSPSYKIGQFPSRLASSKDFLLHFFQDGIVVHDLNTKERYPILFDFKGRELTALSFEGSRCFCGVHWESDQEVVIDYYLFDLEKKKATRIYHFASEGKRSVYMSAAIDKEWVYLGYSCGHLAAVNWGTLVSMERTSSTEPINFLSLQEGVLIAGSYSRNSLYTPGVLKFWDARSLTLIGQVDWLDPQVAPVLSCGKLLMADGFSLVVRDYSQSMSDFSS